ncbi:MAG TPA: hypothetical protein VG225_06845 [Terracidiphilus sp.]|jgi:hypothetical protein|nr:hypothetical protein [Terracidiphilus sp.]
MSRQQLGLLRFVSLLFLLPGLAGLVFSAMISTQYLETMPRSPVPAEMRMVPRNIHGIVIYQTADEDRKLTVMEDASVGVFLVGLGLGLVYLRKWGIAQALGAEDEEKYASPMA